MKIDKEKFEAAVKYLGQDSYMSELSIGNLDGGVVSIKYYSADAAEIEDVCEPSETYLAITD